MTTNKPLERLIDCDECQGKGIFYFTGEERLRDSQYCRKCNGVGRIDEQSR